ncbi:DUF2459 domain-containing protein [Pseudorhodobacter sp.]|uniref:DUF2459 domain-containing protein n=1 Tax=Pseudorhodobacter sp. TaxID=1934400 RepID=UPI002649F600|nr:DUF2459 domain-containing protein [Pseudorhodobacter sp.]MDN5788080.1 DUF2459 domain-containing protein [Pseudorhodobacter sp.]
MRSVLVRVGWLGLILPVLYICVGLVGGMLVTGGPRIAGPKEYRIGLIGGPIHYDLLIPLNAKSRIRFAFAQSAGVPVRNPDAEWLLIGWGAQGFYTSTATLSDMDLPVIWQAATGDGAVMRLDTVGRISSFDGIALIKLTEAEMDALLATLLAAFDGQTALPLPGFTSTDAFFHAKGRFNLFNTCNVWIGQTLRAAGLPFGLWTPFPQSIRLSLTQTGLAGADASARPPRPSMR